MVQRNGFFADWENVLMGMLGDSDNETRILELEKLLSIFQKLSSPASLNDSAMAKCPNKEHSSESACNTFSTVRIFDLSIIDQKATSYDKMVDVNSWQQ